MMPTPAPGGERNLSLPKAINDKLVILQIVSSSRLFSIPNTISSMYNWSMTSMNS